MLLAYRYSNEWRKKMNENFQFNNKNALIICIYFLLFFISVFYKTSGVSFYRYSNFLINFFSNMIKYFLNAKKVML